MGPPALTSKEKGRKKTGLHSNGLDAEHSYSYEQAAPQRGYARDLACI
jgi:hypothetical protein